MTREDKRKYYVWLVDNFVDVGGVLYIKDKLYLILNVYKDGLDVVEISLVEVMLKNSSKRVIYLKTKRKMSALQCRSCMLWTGKLNDVSFITDNDEEIKQSDILGRHFVEDVKKKLLKDLVLLIGSVVDIASDITEKYGIIAEITDDRVLGFMVDERITSQKQMKEYTGNYTTFTMSKWNFLKCAVKIGQIDKEYANTVYIKTKLTERQV